MADPTAALHGAVKSEVSTSATATIDSDSATVAVGDWLYVCIGGVGDSGTWDYTIAKQSGTATVGASVTPTSPLGQAATAAGNDGGTYNFRDKHMYLPVTGAGTLVVRATRTAGNVDHAWFAAFIRVQAPGSIGAVGIVANNTSATTLAVTMDAAPAATSMTIGSVYSNNGQGSGIGPGTLTELSDQNDAFGVAFETGKDEGSPNQAVTWTTLVAGTFGRAGVLVEIKTASTATNAPAGNAAGTGAASGPTASINPSAGQSTGTGAAGAPTASVKPTSGAATGTGAAFAPGLTLTSNAAGGSATGTGTASGPTVNVQASAAAATGTGAASQPGLTLTSNAAGGSATGTGSAGGPAVTVAPPGGSAAGTGAASGPSTAVAVGAGSATGTGAALAPTVTTGSNTNASAEAATGTGAASPPSLSIKPTAGQATGTGAALQPTVSTTAQTNASAGNAAGTGATSTPSLSLKPNAGAATGTGSAGAVVAAISPSAGSAPALGAAMAASVWLAVQAALAVATGQAYQPSTTGGDVFLDVAPQMADARERFYDDAQEAYTADARERYTDG